MLAKLRCFASAASTRELVQQRVAARHVVLFTACRGAAGLSRRLPIAGVTAAADMAADMEHEAAFAPEGEDDGGNIAPGLALPDRRYQKVC